MKAQDLNLVVKDLFIFSGNNIMNGESYKLVDLHKTKIIP